MHLIFDCCCVQADGSSVEAHDRALTRLFELKTDLATMRRIEDSSVTLLKGYLDAGERSCVTHARRWREHISELKECCIGTSKTYF